MWWDFLRVFQTTVCTWVEMIEILFCYLFFTPFLSLTWNTMKSSISKKCIFKGWIAPWLLKIQPCQVSQIMHWIHVFLGRKKLNTLLRSLLYLFQQELLSCLQWHCCVQKKDASPTWSCCLLQGVLSFKKPRDSLALLINLKLSIIDISRSKKKVVNDPLPFPFFFLFLRLPTSTNVTLNHAKLDNNTVSVSLKKSRNLRCCVRYFFKLSFTPILAPKKLFFPFLFNGWMVKKMQKEPKDTSTVYLSLPLKVMHRTF